jgi:hypothetical protein
MSYLLLPGGLGGKPARPDPWQSTPNPSASSMRQTTLRQLFRTVNDSTLETQRATTRTDKMRCCISNCIIHYILFYLGLTPTLIV